MLRLASTTLLLAALLLAAPIFAAASAPGLLAAVGGRRALADSPTSSPAAADPVAAAAPSAEDCAALIEGCVKCTRNGTSSTELLCTNCIAQEQPTADYSACACRPGFYEGDGGVSPCTACEAGSW